MSERAWRFYLDDMIAFAQKVLAYTQGMEQQAFVASGLHCWRNEWRSKKIGQPIYKPKTRCSMRPYQKAFIEFALAQGVLCFGEFTLKSGRKSPYFFNSGLFNTGARLAELGRFYAQALIEQGLPFDMLYGPAYKGIPLVATVSIALADRHARDVPYAFNRKETKDHGEGGSLVGAKLAGRVLIVDDVISAGTSVRESVDTIRAHGAEVAGVLIALDRQEKGKGDISAIAELEQQFQLRVASIIRLNDLIDFLAASAQFKQHLPAVRAYRERYGTA